MDKKTPVISPHVKHCYFDVDNTLLFPIKDYPLTPYDLIRINEQSFCPYYRHIEDLKVMSARGFTIIVWSAAGSEWANKVVTLLELEPWVDFVLGKPDWYFDDKEVEEWMPECNRIYND